MNLQKENATDVTAITPAANVTLTKNYKPILTKCRKKATFCNVWQRLRRSLGDMQTTAKRLGVFCKPRCSLDGMMLILTMFVLVWFFIFSVEVILWLFQ